MMIKKIAGLSILLTMLTTTPVLASVNPNTPEKAAPAIAVEMLKNCGVKVNGDILRQVTEQMGPGGTFMGMEKSDPHYKHHVMHYLHEDLGVMGDQDCMTHGQME